MKDSTFVFIRSTAVSWDRSHLFKKTVSEYQCTCFNLKLNNLLLELITNFPLIKVSKVKNNLLTLTPILIQLIISMVVAANFSIKLLNYGTGPKGAVTISLVCVV